MNRISTNVLVIGRSGVGKSSLLNYLFNKEVQKTGTGKPVTEKGLFPFDYHYDDKFTIRIYDTWGLEPDKADDWKILITSEVKKHDKEKIKDWFNTIIYCLSANSDRIEDFEIEIIKALVETNNQLVIAVTHCENSSDLRAEVIKRRVISLGGVKEQQIVFLSNVEKKLIGKKVSKFGREEVFTVIIRNLWESLKYKVPFNIRENLQDRFKAEEDKLYGMISEQRLVFQRDKKLDLFEKKVNEELEAFLSDVMDDINTQFTEAMDYYNLLSFRYAEIGLLNKEEILEMPEVHFDTLKGFYHEVEATVNLIRVYLGDVIDTLNSEVSKEVLLAFFASIKKYFSSSKEVKETLFYTVGMYIDKVKKIIDEQIDAVQLQLQEINVDQIELLMQRRDDND